MTLDIITNFMGECRKSSLWPSTDLSIREIVEVLQMSGIGGRFTPTDIGDVTSVINHLITHLMYQRPIVIYCLMVDGYVLLDSNVSIDIDGVHVKPYTLLSKYPYNGCEAAFAEFVQYHEKSPRYQVTKPDQLHTQQLLQQQQARIIKLEAEIESLKARVKPQEYTTRLLQQKDDMLRTLQTKVAQDQLLLEQSASRETEVQKRLEELRRQPVQNIDEIQRLKTGLGYSVNG